jgi:hypothetical protein
MAHRYELTFQDFKNAQRLYRAHRPWARFWLGFWLIGAPVIGLLLLVIGLMAHSRSLGPLLYPIAGWFLFMGIFQHLYRPFQLRKIYKRSLPDGQKTADVEFSFGEEGVRSAILGRSEGRFNWSAIQDYAEDDTLSLIFVKKKLFLYIPKRAMPAEEWDDLRRYVHMKTGKL